MSENGSSRKQRKVSSTPVTAKQKFPSALRHHINVEAAKALVSTMKDKRTGVLPETKAWPVDFVIEAKEKFGVHIVYVLKMLKLLRSPSVLYLCPSLNPLDGNKEASGQTAVLANQMFHYHLSFLSAPRTGMTAHLQSPPRKTVVQTRSVFGRARILLTLPLLWHQLIRRSITKRKRKQVFCIYISSKLIYKFVYRRWRWWSGSKETRKSLSAPSDNSDSSSFVAAPPCSHTSCEEKYP